MSEEPSSDLRAISEQLCMISADLRAWGDVALVCLDDNGVAPAPITLADELWLIAFQLDQDEAMKPRNHGGEP